MRNEASPNILPQNSDHTDCNNQMVMNNMLQLFTSELSESCARTGLPHPLPTLASKNPALSPMEIYAYFTLGFLHFRWLYQQGLDPPTTYTQTPTTVL